MMWHKVNPRALRARTCSRQNSAFSHLRCRFLLSAAVGEPISSFFFYDERCALQVAGGCHHRHHRHLFIAVVFAQPTQTAFFILFPVFPGGTHYFFPDFHILAPRSLARGRSSQLQFFPQKPATAWSSTALLSVLRAWRQKRRTVFTARRAKKSASLSLPPAASRPIPRHVLCARKDV